MLKFSPSLYGINFEAANVDVANFDELYFPLVGRLPN